VIGVGSQWAVVGEREVIAEGRLSVGNLTSLGYFGATTTTRSTVRPGPVPVMSSQTRVPG
jgi:hypothetical protein